MRHDKYEFVTDYLGETIVVVHSIDNVKIYPDMKQVNIHHKIGEKYAEFFTIPLSMKDAVMEIENLTYNKIKQNSILIKKSN
jgi:asparagine synthetase A